MLINRFNRLPLNCTLKCFDSSICMVFVYCSSFLFDSALYRAFSITWPAAMQIYKTKRKRLQKKRVQLPQDLFGTPTWPPFYCFGAPIWPPWRHVKTLCLFLALHLWYALSIQLGIILYVLDHYRILSDELASASSNLFAGYYWQTSPSCTLLYCWPIDI